MKSIEEDLFGGRKKQPINQKQKGNRNELVVAKLLSEWTGSEFTRVPMSGGLRWKNAVNICGDVVSTDPSFDFPFSVETKHIKYLGIDWKDLNQGYQLRKNSVLYRYFEQASRDAERAGKKPLLIIRQNDMPEKEYFLIFRLEGLFSAVMLNSGGATQILFGDNIAGFLFSEIKNIEFKQFIQWMT